MKYVKVSKRDIDEYIEKYDLLVCRLRTSRNKAKQLAILEMSSCLMPVEGVFVFNGPLGDVKGVISFFVKKGEEQKLLKILKTVGYCDRFYILDFSLELPGATKEIPSVNEYYWKGRPFNVIPFYKESKNHYLAQSISNRIFAIYQNDNTVKYVKGYRGDSREAGRRGLPLEDTRMLVNLVKPHSINTFLDPFAGSGGIVYTAKSINPSLYVMSADIDRILEPGLSMYSDKHYTCDARELDLNDNKVDAIVTEIPFSKNYTHVAIQAFYNLIPCLAEQGKLLCMCHADQTKELVNAMQDSGLSLVIDKAVNRKGTPVNILLWAKSRNFYENYMYYFQMLKTVI